MSNSKYEGNKNKLLRVTQMNAAFFDKEIEGIFWQQIQECLEYLPPGLISTFEPELKFLLTLTILSFSILKHDRTFGQKLLQIKYENMTKTKKILYVVANCFDYIKTRFESFMPNYEITNLLFKIHTAVLLGNLISLSIFLRTGEKPKLIEKVLGLKQTYESSFTQRHYDNKYMARELLWNGLIEILVYILPLINYHRMKRIVKNLNPFHKKIHLNAIVNRIITVTTRCPHCNDYPVLPHHMGCAHIFCYSCLKGNQIADPNYECPICEYRSSNHLCDPVS